MDLPAGKTNIHEDIEYLRDRRDRALESFNRKIKRNTYNQEAITAALDSVLRVNKQLKMLEDAAKILNEK
jgi:hypothetical protein